MQVIRFERTGPIGHTILCSPPGNLIAVAFLDMIDELLALADEVIE